MTNKAKRSLVIVAVVFLILLASSDFIIKKWQEYRLDQEFVCPETQSKEEAESSVYKYLKFYKDNFPEITIDTLLSMRMKLLVSHDCITTLKNLTENNNDTAEY
jgi:hypothetical protein